MQETPIPYSSWAIVSESGNVNTLHSFSGLAEFKERSNGYVILTVTVSAYIFRVAVEEEAYDQREVSFNEVPQSIEVITLTRAGYAFSNTRWVVLGGTPMSARMVFDS